MNAKLLRALLALGTALTFFLNAPVPAFAAEKPKISFEITYEDGKTCLTLTPSDRENTVYYTTDGSRPDPSSRICRSRLSARKSVVIRAAEYDQKGRRIASVRVELKPKCETPSLSAKKTEGGFLVSLSSGTEDCAVYYTTDGSKPKKTSEIYREPFFVKKGTVVRAFAAKSGCEKSSAIKKTVKKETAEKSSPEITADPECEKILEYINGYRAEKGLAPLAFHETLLTAARLRAEELTGHYDHTRPDGAEWFTVFDGLSFPYATAGENIAWTEGHLSTAENVSESWFNSPAHRGNILNEAYDVTGIAMIRKGEKTYWIQLFAKAQ